MSNTSGVYAPRRHFIAVGLALGLLGASQFPAMAQNKAKAGGKATPAGPILVLGDSLSAEYGLARGSGWVALLEQRLANERITTAIVNASVSGETTAGGRSRLPALLAQHKPSVVVIELGGNDALRGLALTSTQENLSNMARSARESGAKVLIVGMQVPPNYGGRYGQQFSALFETVAKAQKSALVPFLLEGIADAPDAQKWFQSDRIHPTAQAQPRMLDNVWPALSRLLR